MHGYISETEADLAKSIRIEDMLSGVSDNFQEVNEKYQAYIDAVIDEVEEVTGESPYSVGMEIHTNMNAYMQEYIYDMQNEEDYVGITFPNEQCQSAIVVLDNQNGAIEALGAGRGETDKARQFNRATKAYLNPGSSIKPVIDYALCIEELGYATSHTFTDMPLWRQRLDFQLRPRLLRRHADDGSAGTFAKHPGCSGFSCCRRRERRRICCRLPQLDRIQI